MAAIASAAPFEILRVDEGGGVFAVRFVGRFAFADGNTLWKQLGACLEPTKRGQETRFDLSAVESIDGGAMALLVQMKWNLESTGARCEFVGAQGTIQKILALYHGDAHDNPQPKVKPLGIFDQIGAATVRIVREAQLVMAFLGGMVLAVGGVLRRPRTGNWREIAPIMNRTGTDALPIVVLINFLLGFVMAFQAAVQLKRFSANIYVADLVGLAVSRELGPLMTAIIVCGRSGSAFAAELGTMKVSEEVDALRTMGFSPLSFLVLPRMLALFLVMPVLTLVADLVGIAGGFVVGVTSLDISITGYYNETVDAMRMWDVFQGVIKCGVFGIAIGLISCQQGLATSGGAEGVGRRTTASVVISLFALILIDAAFTFLFHALHL